VHKLSSFPANRSPKNVGTIQYTFYVWRAVRSPPTGLERRFAQNFKLFLKDQNQNINNVKQKKGDVLSWAYPMVPLSG
jgi:hypothetical protein